MTAASTALSETDVGTALGWPVEAVAGAGPGELAARFQGGGVTVSLALRKFRAIDRAVARRQGRALPGLGDEAWLLKGDHVLIVRVGPTTMTLTLAALPPSARAAVLIPLARIAAARLTASPGD